MMHCTITISNRMCFIAEAEAVLSVYDSHGLLQPFEFNRKSKWISILDIRSQSPYSIQYVMDLAHIREEKINEILK